MDDAICGLPAAAGAAGQAARPIRSSGGPGVPAFARGAARTSPPYFAAGGGGRRAAWAPEKSPAVPADTKSADAGELGGAVRRLRKPHGVRALFRSGSPAFLGCAAWASEKSPAVPADTKSADAGELGGAVRRLRKPHGVRALFRSGSPAFLGCAAWASEKSPAVPADTKSADAGELGGAVRRLRKPHGVRALFRSGSPAFLGCAAWAPEKSPAVPADTKSADAGELGGAVRRLRKPHGVRALFRSGSPAFLGCAAWAPEKSPAVPADPKSAGNFSPADTKSADAGELGGAVRRLRKPHGVRALFRSGSPAFLGCAAWRPAGPAPRSADAGDGVPCDPVQPAFLGGAAWAPEGSPARSGRDPALVPAGRTCVARGSAVSSSSRCGRTWWRGSAPRPAFVPCFDPVRPRSSGAPRGPAEKCAAAVPRTRKGPPMRANLVARFIDGGVRTVSPAAQAELVHRRTGPAETTWRSCPVSIRFARVPRVRRVGPGEVAGRTSGPEISTRANLVARFGACGNHMAFVPCFDPVRPRSSGAPRGPRGSRRRDPRRGQPMRANLVAGVSTTSARGAARRDAIRRSSAASS